MILLPNLNTCCFDDFDEIESRDFNHTIRMTVVTKLGQGSMRKVAAIAISRRYFNRLNCN